MRRLAGIVLCSVLSAVAALGAFRLSGDGYCAVQRQQVFLRQQLEAGAGPAAQASFPEGFFFLHALYGLTEVQLGLGKPPADRGAEVEAATWALGRLETPEGRAPFNPELTPAYGVFYRGWVNWLRGGVLALRPDPGQQAQFEKDSADLAGAFTTAGSPFLPAYQGQAWPVDSTVAIASLKLHDALLPPRFGPVVSAWLTAARARLDPATGLLPHRADPVTGVPLDGARGSSQSIIQRFLPEIDPVFARAQYLAFRSSFRTAPLGLGPAIREYPHGVDGTGDVDSGPLLLGVSLSATVVTLGAARVEGDDRLAGALASYGDFAGLPIDTWTTRRYAFGVLPIGDAFLAWSKSARPLIPATLPAPDPDVSRWWRARLLVILLLLGTTPWLLRLVMTRRVITPPTPAKPDRAPAV